MSTLPEEINSFVEDSALKFIDAYLTSCKNRKFKTRCAAKSNMDIPASKGLPTKSEKIINLKLMRSYSGAWTNGNILV